MAKSSKTTSAPKRPRVDLALQGGGSHGAFTWGALDRLLDEDGVDITGMSGTSAGALNGAVLLNGYVKGFAKGGAEAGRQQAQKSLKAFWKDVSGHGPIFGPLTLQSNGMLKHAFNFDELPGFQLFNMFTQAFSPYEFNPLNLNPLRDVLQRHVDPDSLSHGCGTDGIPLFVTATSVRTGQAKVFTKNELSLDALMASACLPFLFQAVEINGEDYWDGGYTGNPAMYPLIYNTPALDILLIKINVLQRPGKPTRSIDIIDRLSEITFNASLIAEMRAIAFVKRLLQDKQVDAKRYKNLHMHMIADDDGLLPFNASSKLNTDWNFLQALYQLGHAAASKWLSEHRADVGVRSSLDIDKTFLSQS